MKDLHAYNLAACVSELSGIHRVRLRAEGLIRAQSECQGAQEVFHQHLLTDGCNTPPEAPDKGSFVGARRPIAGAPFLPCRTQASPSLGRRPQASGSRKKRSCLHLSYLPPLSRQDQPPQGRSGPSRAHGPPWLLTRKVTHGCTKSLNMIPGNMRQDFVFLASYEFRYMYFSKSSAFHFTTKWQSA